MERNERINSSRPNALLVALKAGFKQNQSDVWTALPAFAGADLNAAKCTVTAQPTVQAQVRQPDGKWIDTTLPLCLDCPVLFPGGGGYTLTFPVKKGDEGLLVFASRCIDAWWQNGGIQKQAELRMHDLSDGFFLPSGGMSNAKVPTNVNPDTVQLRSNDDETYIELASGGIVNLVAPGGFNVTAPFMALNGNLFLGGSVKNHAGTGVYTGDLATAGNVIAGDGTVDQVGLKTHTHPANNQPPTPGT